MNKILTCTSIITSKRFNTALIEHNITKLVAPKILNIGSIEFWGTIKVVLFEIDISMIQWRKSFHFFANI